MAEKDTVALRKRAQIARANRIMFIWVACASVVVSASIVIVIVMVQKGVHNQKAITELNKTVKTLKENNDSVTPLKDSIRQLGSNKSLLALRANESDNALQVILDALPADSNPSALGASLQVKLFQPDLEVESIEVTPAGDPTAASDTTAGDTTSTNTAGVIEFRFTVKGDAAQLKELLERLERSIRTIQLNRIVIESTGDKQSLSVIGHAYYEPAKTLQLKTVEIKP